MKNNLATICNLIGSVQEDVSSPEILCLLEFKKYNYL